MNKIYLISSSIFFIFVLILTINFLDEQIFRTDDVIRISIFSGMLSYVVIYFVFIVIVQHYPRLKKIFYDDRINWIRKSLVRSKKTGDEIFEILGLSLLINFLSAYFLLITTPNQIISRIPGFEGVSLFAGEQNVDFFELVGTITRFDYFLPLTIIGSVIFYVLRFAHLRQNNEDDFPGTRPLLAFLYAVIGIIVIQGVLISTNIVDVGFSFETFWIRIIFSLFFSIFGILSIVSGIFLDRLLLKNLKLK